MRVIKDYPNYHKIYVTENGLGYKDEFDEERKTVDDDARIDYVKNILKSLLMRYVMVLNVKVISYGHLWMCSHGLMVMKNVTVYSTLILTHKNVIRKSAYWYKALAESKRN